jgi:hypothetical protein
LRQSRAGQRQKQQDTWSDPFVGHVAVRESMSISEPKYLTPLEKYAWQLPIFRHVAQMLSSRGQYAVPSIGETHSERGSRGRIRVRAAEG